jgi:hypothetical protein
VCPYIDLVRGDRCGLFLTSWGMRRLEPSQTIDRMTVKVGISGVSYGRYWFWLSTGKDIYRPTAKYRPRYRPHEHPLFCGFLLRIKTSRSIRSMFFAPLPRASEYPSR